MEHRAEKASRKRVIVLDNDVLGDEINPPGNSFDILGIANWNCAAVLKPLSLSPHFFHSISSYTAIKG